jgi:hypothetical protein
MCVFRMGWTPSAGSFPYVADRHAPRWAGIPLGRHSVPHSESSWRGAILNISRTLNGQYWAEAQGRCLVAVSDNTTHEFGVLRPPLFNVDAERAGLPHLYFHPR